MKARPSIGGRRGLSETQSGGRVRFGRWKRWPGILPVAVSSVVAAWLTGCTSHTQTQYFAVKDPNTGAANYYRLSVHGCGSLNKYNLQAGYYSSAAVDILRGRMPDVPELDLPIERAKTYDSLLQRIDQALLQEAKQIAPITDPDVAADNLRDRVGKARAEQARFRDQQSETEKRLAEVPNQISKAEDKVQLVRKDYEARSNAVEQAGEWLRLAKTNSAKACAAMTNLAVAIAKLQEATNGVSQAITNTMPADINRTVTNLAATIAEIKEATNRLGGAIVSSNMPDITPAKMKIADLVAATECVTSGLDETNATLRKAATDPAMLSLAAAIGDVQRVNDELNNQLTSANTANVAKAGEARAARQKELEKAKKGLETAEGEWAAAKRDKARLEDELVLLLTRIKFATQSETNASECILRLEKSYPDSALGLDLPNTSASGLVAKLSDPDAFRTKYIKLSRLAWLSSLSSEDVAAVGMNETLDPFQFRKLVFWTKSKTLNLDQAAGDVEAVMGQVVEIGRNYKNIAKERETAHAQAQADQVTRANVALDALKLMAKDADQSVLTNLVKMLVPKMDSPTQK